MKGLVSIIFASLLAISFVGCCCHHPKHHDHHHEHGVGKMHHEHGDK